MRIFLAFGIAVLIGMLFVFWQPAPPPAINDDPDLSLSAFAGCTVDADCKLVALPCGKIGAANTAQHKFVFNWYQEKIKQQRCPAAAPAALYRAYCDSGICTVAKDTTDPTHVP